MKTQIIISLVAVMAILSSCKKTNPGSPSAGNYFINASENNIAWSSSGNQTDAYHQGPDTVAITGFGNMGKEFLNLRLKFQGIGHYSLTGDQGSLTIMDGEAIMTAKYRLGTDSGNTVDITSYDQMGKIIEGTFDLKLINYLSTNPADPQNVNFTGKFRVLLEPGLILNNGN